MTASVEVEAKRSGPAEYPCVTRLRHRRLFAFLLGQGFTRTFKELLHETDAYMSLQHLCGLVNQGLWGHAIDYLDTYLPPSTTRAPKSLQAQVLRNFLVAHQRFADAVAGNSDKLMPKSYHLLPIHRTFASRADLWLHSITTSIIGSDYIRAGLDWNEVRSQASRALYGFAVTVPELRGCISLPNACTMPRHVLPIASGLCRRKRHVKKKQQSSRRRRTEAIIRALNSPRFEDSIAGVTDINHAFQSPGSVDQAKELLARYLHKSLLDGVSLDSLRSDLAVWKEDRPSWEIKFFDPAENSGISTATNAGAPGAPVCQPMSGTLTEAKSAGTDKHLSEAVCHTKSACQGLDGRKNSRDEPVAVEEGRGPKRQRTTGALDEVSPLSIVEAGEGVGWPAGAVVNLGARPSVSFLGEETGGGVRTGDVQLRTSQRT